MKLQHSLHGRSHLPWGSDPVGLTARMPWVLFQGNLDTQTIPQDTDYYPELTGLLVSPLNAGGTVDSSVFGGIDTGDAEVDIETAGSSNEPFKAVHIRTPGLYYVEASAGWFTDWGPARVNVVSDHSDLDTSVLSFVLRLNSTENSYFGDAPPTKLAGSGPSDAIQYAVIYRNIFAVDSRAADVHLNFFMVNADTSDHTYDSGAARDGGFGFFVVQLSESGASNP